MQAAHRRKLRRQLCTSAPIPATPSSPEDLRKPEDASPQQLMTPERKTDESDNSELLLPSSANQSSYASPPRDQAATIFNKNSPTSVPVAAHYFDAKINEHKQSMVHTDAHRIDDCAPREFARVLDDSRINETNETNDLSVRRATGENSSESRHLSISAGGRRMPLGHQVQTTARTGPQNAATDESYEDASSSTAGAGNLARRFEAMPYHPIQQFRTAHSIDNDIPKEWKERELQLEQFLQREQTNCQRLMFKSKAAYKNEHSKVATMLHQAETKVARLEKALTVAKGSDDVEKADREIAVLAVRKMNLEVLHTLIVHNSVPDLSASDITRIKSNFKHFKSEATVDTTKRALTAIKKIASSAVSDGTPINEDATLKAFVQMELAVAKYRTLNHF